MPTPSPSYIAVKESKLYRELYATHPNVEVLVDPDFHTGGFDHFFIVSLKGKATFNLAFVRLKDGKLERRNMGENGKDVWMPTE